MSLGHGTPSVPTSRWPSRDLVSSLDVVVCAAIVALLTIIGFTIARGDGVGVQLTRMSPTDQARRTSPITVSFSEDMNRASVAARFRVDPAVAGEITWSSRALTFHPSTPFDAGKQYTVVLGAGSESDTGRQLLAEHRFHFTVLGPRIAYLSPIDGPVKDLWVADPSNSAAAAKVTSSRSGLLSYDVSPDGGRVVFAEANATTGSDLKLLDLDSHDVRLLSGCGDSLCTDPVWSPDGTRIAFERRGAIPSAIPGVSRDNTRVWHIDPNSSSPRAELLFADPQVPPHDNPRWSPDGARIAVGQPTVVPGREPGVWIYTFATGEASYFQASGSAGAFSGDGTQYYLPVLAVQDGGVRPVLERADLETAQTEVVPRTGSPLEPVELSRQPGTNALTVGRRFTGDERSLGRQLYRLRDEGSLIPLLVDASYDHSAIAWDPGGQMLLFERSQLKADATNASYDARSQVWLYDLANNRLSRIATDAFLPRWVP